MKSLKYLRHYSLCIVLLTGFLQAGCKRDIPPLPAAESRNVTFKLTGFGAETLPMGESEGVSRLALGTAGNGVQALLGMVPSTEPQYLYYWSFNDATTTPSIAVDEVEAGITFDVEADFKSGFSYDTVGAGNALSLEGVQELEITLPLQAVESLTTFDFDISSSNTGPKDFSVSFSIDNGHTYEELHADNQFEKMAPQSRNSFSFDFSDSLQFIGTEFLKLKFAFLPGERPARDTSGVYEYSLSSGTVRFDNIRLSGVYSVISGNPTVPSMLHYYIFSSADGGVVQQQQLAMNDLGEGGTLDVNLADGTYDVLFVAYRSGKGMLLPDGLKNANEFYFGQHFDDYQAVTYAALLDDIVVGETQVEETATLSRCYSLVEFDFTDNPAILRQVKKIGIVKLHDNFWYTPFGMPTSKEESEAQRIEFSNFNQIEDYKIALHQFFGLLDTGGSVGYEVTAYGEGDVVLNTVTITQTLRSNVVLRLTGKLLGDSGAINGFSVTLDTEWRETMEHVF